MPSFDVIHRGMGPDGHTASLFPGDRLVHDWLVHDRQSLTATMWIEQMHQARVTLLPGVLEAARNTVMLVTGADKAEVLDSVLRGPKDPLKYPAQIAADKATWFLDKAAGSLLPID
jgi:6-phosphogluconolactonase